LLFINSQSRIHRNKKDAAGLFFHVDDNTDFLSYDPYVTTNNTTKVKALTSANVKSLRDASFDLIKTGDIIIYK